jgi:hypothetical protein
VSNCDEVILGWKPPMNAGGGELTAFRIKYSASYIKGVKRTTPPADDMVIVQTIADPEARRASIRGLLPGTTYSFRMVCQSEYGWGKASRGLYATTLSHPVPRFVAGERQKHSLELAWSVPGGFIDVTEVQIELWQYSQSNIDDDELLEDASGGVMSDGFRSGSALDSFQSSSAFDGERPRTSQSAIGPPGLQQRASSSRCITIDAQRHDHCTLKDLAPGTVCLGLMPQQAVYTLLTQLITHTRCCAHRSTRFVGGRYVGLPATTTNVTRAMLPFWNLAW